MVDKSFSFHKKNVFDLEKTKAKILDPKKDSVSRMRYMKLLSDKCSFHEIEDFYKKYYTFIYHTIHEHMKTAENLQARPGAASSKQSEAKELAVSIFEVLLCWIPNVINKKWQYHSIVSVIRNMLQADILSKTFSDGLKLFILWYSILMENAEENEHMLFSRLFMSHDGSNDLFKFNLLLKVVVTEMKRIYWDEQINSYTFVFRKLEVCYLRKVFPHYQRIDYSSFQPELLGDVPLHSESGLPNHQQMLVDWLMAIVGSNKRAHSMNREKFGIMVEELLEKFDAENQEDSRPRTLSSELVTRDAEGPTVPQGKKLRDDKHEFVFSTDERLSMQRILFSNKSVVNMVLEIFHQSFTGTFGRSKLVREVCLIYKLWLKGQQSPAFLQQSLQKSSSSSAHLTSEKVQILCLEDLFKIGKQQFIRVFICQSCAIFFCNWKSLDGLDQNASLYGVTQEQMKVCGQVLNLYRYLIMDAAMETQTWTCLLEKLMKICKYIVMPSAEGFSFLDELGKKLVETLLVAFVRSSLNGHVTRKLWDDMTSLMTSMTNVDSVVQQWGSIMVMLTKMLGHSIYNVDLVSSSSGAKKQRRKFKNPKMREIHFCEDAVTKGAEESTKIETDIEKESYLEDESISSVVSTSEDSVNKDDSKKGINKSLNSSESSDPSAEKNLDSTLSVSDAETPTDINDDNRGSPPPSSCANDSSTETVDPSKDARSSLDRSESSGSLENSLSVGLSAPGEFDDNSTPVCAESLERSYDESPEGIEVLTTEVSIEDKQVEVDLNEIRDCSLGEEGLTFVWLKMLAIFGNITVKADCHRCLVADNLKPIHDCLLKIYKHRDFVGSDTFPILVLIPWLLQIIHTQQQLLQNKLIAYSMIGDYMLHVPLPPHYLNRFYFSIHLALQSPVKDVSHAIIRHYSKQIFGHQLHRGIIILLEGFVKVALNIICYGEELAGSHIPDKIEASRLLASLVSIPNHYHNLKVLDPNSSQVQLKACDTDHLKDIVINALVSSVNNHQGLSGVCSIGIRGLGIFLHEEILRNANNRLIPRVVGCLLSVFAKDVSSSNHSNIDKLLACQSLSALRDHHHHLLLTNNFKDMLRLILQTLLGYVHRSLVIEDLVNELKVIHSIIYCLLDWFLVLPVTFLMEEVDGLRLLDHFLKILLELNCKCRSDGGKMHENTKSMFHLRLFINFVYCHLVNYIGCHHDLQERSTESHPWQLMAWFGTRIFEATCSLKDIHSPLISTDPLGFPIYLITLRDVTGKWQWFMQEANVLSRKYELTRSRLQDTNDLTCPTLKRQSASDFSEDDEDILIKALNLIADTSPECFPNSEHHSLTVPLPCLKVDPVQDPLITSFVQQNKDIYEFLMNSDEKISPCERSSKKASNGFFNSEMLMKIGQSFGLLQFQGRDRLDFLNRGDQLMREIKHFDGQKCLETHKIGVFYVGPNQNDKIDILKNEKGSPIFEQFCSQLGDLVNLRHHKGFLGGLSTSGSTGEVAPYYSPSSVLQVMFHVSTLLSPSQADGSSEDICVTKMRHLGNDEVHIVWMDNRKCYSPDIVATKFGEVTIVIYPLPRLLFRIQIFKKIMMDTFGPLFDGSIVGWSNLAALVRATAINAGRAIRETRDFYLKFYEERYATLLKIVTTYKKQETYEQFLYSAMMPGAKEMGPISYLSTETRDNADLAQITPTKPERRIRMDAATTKKRSEFVLPLKTKSEKKSQDMK